VYRFIKENISPRDKDQFGNTPNKKGSKKSDRIFWGLFLFFGQC